MWDGAVTRSWMFSQLNEVILLWSERQRRNIVIRIHVITLGLDFVYICEVFITTHELRSLTCCSIRPILGNASQIEIQALLLLILLKELPTSQTHIAFILCNYPPAIIPRTLLLGTTRMFLNVSEGDLRRKILSAILTLSLILAAVLFRWWSLILIIHVLCIRSLNLVAILLHFIWI